jgi:hypothetical protein
MPTVGFEIKSLRGCKDCALGRTELGVSWAANVITGVGSRTAQFAPEPSSFVGSMDQDRGNRTSRMGLVGRDDLARRSADRICAAEVL